MVGVHLACALLWAAAVSVVEPPTVESLDFDAMPIAAPRLEDVETALTALEGKAPSRESTERVWWTLAAQARVDFADVVRLADCRPMRRKLDEVYQEHLGRPATIAEVMEWTAEMRPLSDASVVGARLRRLAKNKDRKLEGTVIDADGRPVEGALLRNWTRGWSAKSDDSGKFVFENFIPRDFYLLAIAEKGDLYGRHLPIGEESDKSPIQIRLGRMKRVAIRVKDSEGKPIPNAAVVVSADGDMRNPQQISYAWQSIAHTDGDGKADVGQLLQGDEIQTVSARHRQFAPRISGGGGNPWATELTLERGVEIRGRIVGPDGQSLEGARIRCLWDGDRSNPIDHLTDRQGRFSLPVSQGRYTLVAEHPDWALAALEIDAEAGKPFDELTVKLSEGLYIEGRVERDGKPVPFTNVGWMSVDSLPDFNGKVGVVHPGNFTATNAGGAYRLGPLPKGGRFKAMAVVPEGGRLYSSQSVEPGAKDATIVLRNEDP